MTNPERMSGVSGDALRMIMRRLPSPVTIITTSTGSEVRGITIGSFASTSLEPALVSFNVSLESPMLELLRASDEFVVHFLEESQAFLSEHFAVPDRSGAEQFAAVDHALSPSGVPLIAGVLARLSCTVESMHDAGDHMLVVGLVREVTDLREGRPLLYYDRRYLSVG